MIYIFVSDGDGHHYKIPRELKDEFNMLLYDEDNSGMECWEREEWHKFEDMMCEHHEIEDFLIEHQNELNQIKEIKGGNLDT